MLKHRIFILMCLFLSIYLGLSLKMAYFQVLKGPEIVREATAMRSKQIELREYSRGEILDRNLLPLTSTLTSMALYCLPGEFKNTYQKDPGDMDNKYLNDVSESLARLIDNQDEKDILSRLQNGVSLGFPFIRLASDLTEQEIQRINSSGLSGIVVAPVVKRYRQDGFCAHLLGYMGGGDDSQGQDGLERYYNDILKGSTSTRELVSVVDARGLAIQGLMFRVKQEQEEQKGALVLTIDKRIQEIVEKSMSKQNKNGAVVVMDVHNNEVLAMVSRPTFNPYRVEDVIDYDQQSALRNRALSSYHPGSLFKILVTAAALEEKVVKVDDSFDCTGEYVFNDRVAISCWQEEGHGEIDFSEAFALSCNPAFIEVGLRLGRENLLDYVNAFHINDKTIVGYNDITASYVRIDPGEIALANACLGQQGVRLTPLQLTSMLATIADDGYWGPPSLIRYHIDKEGKKNIPEMPKKKQVISIETSKTVQKLMEKVVDEGTGTTVALSETKVAGKTGTSQTGSRKEDGEEILNTWFGGYFPADNPRWAIVILVEDGKTGASDAAPIFKDIAQSMLKCFSVTAEK